MTSRNKTPARSALCLGLLSILMASGEQVEASEALAREQGCLGCHAMETVLVGPSYREVAEKYSGDKDALTALTRQIREGGSGKWGDIAMPPQPQVSATDAKRLAKWILGGKR
jgi:cytochrome c